MISFYKKYYKTIFDISLIILTILLFMFLFSYLYKIAAPIFFSFLIFAVIEPLAKFLHRKGMKKSIATGISLFFFIIIIVGLVVGLSVIIVTQISNIQSLIPTYSEILQEQIARHTIYLQAQWDRLPVDLAQRIIEYASRAAEFLAGFTTWLLGWLLSFFTSFTVFLFNLFIGTLLAYFLSVEIDMWKRLLRENAPSTFKTAFAFMKENVLLGIGTYLKAQLKLISISGSLVFIGLLVSGIDNAFTIALICMVLDILPVVGLSTFFIPWIIYLFIVGNYALAIKISIITAIVLLTRQVMEPKITGDSLGVSAFTMFCFIVISLSLFGIAGLILAPILIITIKALHQQGYLKRWIRKPEDDFNPEYID